MMEILSALAPWVIGLLLLHAGFVAGMWVSRQLLVNSHMAAVVDALANNNPNRRSQTWRRRAPLN